MLTATDIPRPLNDPVGSRPSSLTMLFPPPLRFPVVGKGINGLWLSPRPTGGIPRARGQTRSSRLADEPTGNLDSRSSVEIIASLQRLNDEGITVVIVTHEPEIVAHTRRAISVRDGVIVDDAPVRDQRRAVPAGAGGHGGAG